MPDTDSYLERIRDLSTGNDPLVVQESTAHTIAELVAGVPEARLLTRPHPDKWSVVEIVAHLAEDELVTSWRYRQMLENSGSTLAGFDQDKWALYGRYREWAIGDALTMFRLLRQANLRMLRRLQPEELRCFGIHAERGQISIANLIAHMAGHDLNHIEQIRRALSA